MNVRVNKAAKLAPVKKSSEVMGENLKEISVITYCMNEKLPSISTYRMPSDYVTRQEAAQEIIGRAFGWATKQWLRTNVEAVYVQEVTNVGLAYTIGVWE